MRFPSSAFAILAALAVSTGTSLVCAHADTPVVASPASTPAALAAQKQRFFDLVASRGLNDTFPSASASQIVALALFTRWADGGNGGNDAQQLAFAEFSPRYAKASAPVLKERVAAIGTEAEAKDPQRYLELLSERTADFKRRYNGETVFEALAGDRAGILLLPRFLEGAQTNVAGAESLRIIVRAWPAENELTLGNYTTGRAFAEAVAGKLFVGEEGTKKAPPELTLRIRKSPALLQPEQILLDETDKGDGATLGFIKKSGNESLYNLDGVFSVVRRKGNGFFANTLLAITVNRSGADNAATLDKNELTDKRGYHARVVRFGAQKGSGFLRANTFTLGPSFETDLANDARILTGEATWTPILGFRSFQTSNWERLGKNVQFFLTPTLALGISDVREQNAGGGLQDSRYLSARLRSGFRLRANDKTLATLTYFRAYSRTLSGDTGNPTHQDVQLEVPLDSKERVSLGASYKSGAKTPTSSIERGYDVGFTLKY
ncbi:MAG TPA: hypothetical protein VF627_11085 [Abditibacterium sp.]|jgi:hypothetical protein